MSSLTCRDLFHISQKRLILVFSWSKSQYRVLNTKIRKEELFPFIDKILFRLCSLSFQHSSLASFLPRAPSPPPTYPEGNSHTAHSRSFAAILLSWANLMTVQWHLSSWFYKPSVFANTEHFLPKPIEFFQPNSPARLYTRSYNAR